MAQIKSITENDAQEVINLHIDTKEFDFKTITQMAKEKARETCDNPMILSWKNKNTGEEYPNYECGSENSRPFWIRYAEGRGANLTIDFNDGEYVFMVLKI